MEEPRLLEIPMEVWQHCIFEYWLGPIHKIELNNHDQIMKFKQNFQRGFVERLNLSNVRTVQKFCSVSKKFKELFVEEMNDFWRRVANVLEMVVYWKRYESSETLSLARGDISVYESLGHVKLQKLIEATEMNNNREYSDIIDPNECSDRWSGHSDVDLTTIPNEFDTQEVNSQFEKRIQQLLLSDERFEKIEKHNQISAYDLFLHKALILSLDMISYFDSEKHSEYYGSYDTFENCCLISKGLFTNDSSNPTSLGLMIDLKEYQHMDMLASIASHYIALTINLDEWTYQGFTIPNHIQILCFRFECATFFDEGALLFENFLEEKGPSFPNIKDLSIKFGGTEENANTEQIEKIELNIIAGLTRKRFPKLLRISLQGFSILETLGECDLLREVPYVEIIPTSNDVEYETITNWSDRKVHDLIQKQFITNNSLIQYLVVHANISITGGDADYDTIKEYYDLSLGRFVASISHSSFIEYYDKSYE